MPTLQPLNTGSLINSAQGNDTTRTALSTFIVVKVGGIPVGALQTLSIQQVRQITPIDEIGTDGSIDSSPIQSTRITGSVKRLRYDLAYLTTAFSRDYLNIAAARIPFDIDIFDNWNGSGSSSVITTLKNVWFNQLSVSFTKDNWLITEDANFMAEQIYSSQNGNPASLFLGARGTPTQQNSIELATDTGAYRGSLNIGGLIDDFFTGI